MAKNFGLAPKINKQNLTNHAETIRYSNSMLYLLSLICLSVLLCIVGALDIFVYTLPRFLRKAVTLCKTTKNCIVLKQSTTPTVVPLIFYVRTCIQPNINYVAATRLHICNLRTTNTSIFGILVSS